ncbi:MAG TPA: hypothetical protein PKV95_12290, partial [Anaerolineaceae bacterium]|nr:hypothetical protein [Anaerolineaceae bacterium]
MVEGCCSLAGKGSTRGGLTAPCGVCRVPAGVMRNTAPAVARSWILLAVQEGAKECTKVFKRGGATLVVGALG